MTGRTEVKASIIRGHIKALERAGLFKAVVDRVSPSTREMLIYPPPNSAWIDFKYEEDLAVAVTALTDVATWRRIVHEAVVQGMAPLLRAATEGILRAFGATPHTLFKRLNQMNVNNIRGFEIEYTLKSDTACDILISYAVERTLPHCVYYGAAGGLEIIFDFCRVRGTLGEPDITPGGRHNTARFAARWT